MVNENKIIQVMDRYNLQKILMSPQIINSSMLSFDWLKNIFPEIDLLKYKRRLKSFYILSNKRNDLYKKNKDIGTVENHLVKFLYYRYQIQKYYKNFTR